MRAEQVIALSAPALTRRIVVALGERYPLATAAMSPIAVAALVRGAIGRAAAAGMRSERQMVRYAALALVVRADFETSDATAWARAVLADTTTSAEHKLVRLYALARREGCDMASHRD